MSIIFPPALYLPSGSSVVEFDEEPWSDIEADPRGILLMWSPGAARPQVHHGDGFLRKGITGLDPRDAHSER